MDLGSVLAKIDRACEHTQAIKNEIRAWGDRQPYFITRDVNANSTVYRLIANIGIEPPLQKWTLMVGDAIHNLRSALDHLIYAVAVYEASGQNPPPDENRLSFPICDSPEKFRDSSGKIKSLSAGIRTAIETCQPYNRRHPDLPPLLSILAVSDNTDKHKMLRLAQSAIVKGNVGFVGPGALNANSVTFSANAGEIKNGTEIITGIFQSPTPDMEFQSIDVAVVIALCHGKRDPSGPDGSDRTDVSSLFALLTKEVRDVVRIVADASK
jgi:hypothetical protein